MLGKIKVELICDSCHESVEEVEATTTVKKTNEQTKVIMFVDHLPEGWAELSINKQLKSICRKCLKGVETNEFV